MYFANPTTGTAGAMRDGWLGFIDTPAQGNKRPAGVTWCADNGVFGKGYPGDSGWLTWLRSNASDAASCRFAVVPDAICDHQRTYRRSDRLIDTVRQLGFPAAFVAQDGAAIKSIDWDRIDALFIGGSTEWKFSRRVREIVTHAKAEGKWVHMGRVNSQRRFRYAHDIGCDSADGTYLTFGPSINLPKLRGWVRQLDQLTLTPLATHLEGT